MNTDTNTLAGKTGLWTVKGVRVPVRILSARTIAGRTDLTVQPIGGDGQANTSTASVTIEQTPSERPHQD